VLWAATRAVALPVRRPNGKEEEKKEGVLAGHGYFSNSIPLGPRSLEQVLMASSSCNESVSSSM